jgi:hypothetical protein
VEPAHTQTNTEGTDACRATEAEDARTQSPAGSTLFSLFLSNFLELYIILSWHIRVQTAWRGTQFISNDKRAREACICSRSPSYSPYSANAVICQAQLARRHSVVAAARGQHAFLLSSSPPLTARSRRDPTTPTADQRNIRVRLASAPHVTRFLLLESPCCIPTFLVSSANPFFGGNLGCCKVPLRLEILH